MVQRYELQKALDGEWEVIDRFTGQSVVEQGVTMTDMPLEEADDLVDLLNWMCCNVLITGAMARALRHFRRIRCSRAASSTSQ